eukprot:COSAG04_NODE_234_length_19155_cov_812.438707_9_plen_109_part_00
MLTVMPIVVVPCLVGGYWLPTLLMRCCVREEWDGRKHGNGTAVMQKNDGRRGVATYYDDMVDKINVRFDDDGSMDQIKPDDVLVVETCSLHCACQCLRGKVGVKQATD